jgi:hypothetical protein
MTITKKDMDKMVNLCYWYNRNRFIDAWMSTGADKNLAEHLFEKFIQHSNGLDIAGFYASLDKENRRRFLIFLKIY